jgi:hypothetical protein
MPQREASCSCGQLKVTVAAEPGRVSICHCLQCQRRTGSVCGAQARFPNSAVDISGESRLYIRVGDEGNRIAFNFCPNCGATVYYTVEDQPDLVAIPVGAFADPAFPAPSFSVYEERMHSWVRMPDGIDRQA